METTVSQSTTHNHVELSWTNERAQKEERNEKEIPYCSRL